MKSILILIILLLLLTTSVLAMDPPAIEWETLYGSVFYDVLETSNGNYIVAGRKWYSDFKKTVFLYSPSGDQIWEYGETSYPNTLIGYAVLELQSGDFVATGDGISEASSTQTSLSIYKISSDGQAIWSKLYLLEDNSRSCGYSIAQLPDGGFAVCGRKNPLEGMDQAWILRTDAMGDTLWTREWGWQYNDKAMTVLYIDNGLTVLMHGSTETTEGGPHLVRYDMEGNLLWETTLEVPSPSSTAFAQEMCRASDGGLLLLDNYLPEIAHFDILGNYNWYFQPPGNGQNYGWSVSTTMDGGILYAGENRWMEPNGSKSEVSGMISRHDFQGNELWRDYVYNSECKALYSACQLSQGGYIAAGEAYSSTDGYQGYLIKYAPELGIESGDVSGVEITSVSPNPFSSSLSITCNLPSQLETTLTVYDLNGRIVDVVEAGSFPAGEHTVLWTPSSELSSGCYLIKLRTDTGTDVRKCVLLRE